MLNKVNSALMERRTQKAGADTEFQKLFGLDTESQTLRVISLPIDRLLDFPNQPFKLYTDEQLAELARSISEHGLLNPIKVRPIEEDQYEVLAGRNRKNACTLLGWTEIDAFVEECDDDTAKLIMLTSNLNQRQRLLPSEKAFAYKMQMDILRRQGKRTDLEQTMSSTQIAWKRESAQRIAEQSETSRDDIRRHIRLTWLLPELLDAVDKGEIPFMAGVDFSYLCEENQKIVSDWLKGNGFKVTVKQSRQIYRYAKENDLTVDAITHLLAPVSETALNQTFRISKKKLADYADLLPQDNREFENLFEEFLEWLRERNGDV